MGIITLQALKTSSAIDKACFKPSKWYNFFDMEHFDEKNGISPLKIAQKNQFYPKFSSINVIFNGFKHIYYLIWKILMVFYI